MNAPSTAIFSKTVTLIFNLDLETLTMVRKKGFYPKEYTCICVKYENFITYHSKAMANVTVLADKQTDRQMHQRTGQKTVCPRYINAGGNKNRECNK